MKQLIAPAMAVALLSSVALAQPGDVGSVQVAAMKGDYQAQRNLAYGYASSPYSGQKKDAQMACSWYLLILRSDSPKLHAGDIGNVVTYCDKLDFDVRLAAERKANELHRTIYAKK